MARLAILLLALTACGTEGRRDVPCGGQRTSCTTPIIDGNQPSPPRDLCELCTDASDCASGVCRMYGDGYRKCSQTCTVDDATQCTAPSSMFCNNMGYCGCPQVPVDAGVPLDGERRDAAEGPF